MNKKKDTTEQTAGTSPHSSLITHHSPGITSAASIDDMKRVSVAALVVLLVACAGNIRPVRQIDDAVLAQSVRDALAADPSLRGYDITVNASGGTVTLLGTVGSAAERDRATAVAGGVAGVSQVENLLSIR